jgi:hypothetical protein
MEPKYDDSELSKALDKIDAHLSGSSVPQQEVAALRKSVEDLEDREYSRDREQKEQGYVTQAQLAEMRAAVAKARQAGVRSDKKLAKVARELWRKMRQFDRDQSGLQPTNAGGESRDISKSLIGKTISYEELGEIAPMLKANFPRGAAKVPYDKAIASKLVMCKSLSLAEAQLWAKTNLVPADGSLRDGGARVEAQEDARRRVTGMLAALGVSCLVLPPSLIRRGN